MLSFLQTSSATQFFQTPSRLSSYHRSCARGWVNFFFLSNFLLLFPVGLTFHALGQITRKPLPLSLHGLLLGIFPYTGGTCGRPWEGGAGWEEGPGTASSQAGFLLPDPISRTLRPVTFSPTLRAHCSTPLLLCREAHSWSGCLYLTGTGELHPLQIHRLKSIHQNLRV